MRSWCTGATWASPRAVDTNTGTTTTTATTSCRGSSVVEPNIVVNTGANATIGTAAAALTSGLASSDTTRDRAARSARPTPTTNPATSPTRAFPPVTAAVARMVGNDAATCAAMALGAGSRKAGTPVTATTSSHSSSAATPNATGGQIRPGRKRRRGPATA